MLFQIPRKPDFIAIGKYSEIPRKPDLIAIGKYSEKISSGKSYDRIFTLKPGFQLI